MIIYGKHDHSIVFLKQKNAETVSEIQRHEPFYPTKNSMTTRNTFCQMILEKTETWL